MSSMRKAATFAGFLFLMAAGSLGRAQDEEYPGEPPPKLHAAEPRRPRGTAVEHGTLRPDSMLENRVRDLERQLDQLDQNLNFLEDRIESLDRRVNRLE